MLKPRPFENARKRCSQKQPQIVGTVLEETCFEVVDPAGPPQKASGPESGGHPSHDGRHMRYKLAASGLLPVTRLRCWRNAEFVEELSRRASLNSCAACSMLPLLSRARPIASCAPASLGFKRSASRAAT